MKKGSVEGLKHISLLKMGPKLKLFLCIARLWFILISYVQTIKSTEGQDLVWSWPRVTTVANTIIQAANLISPSDQKMHFMVWCSFVLWNRNQLPGSIQRWNKTDVDLFYCHTLYIYNISYLTMATYIDILLVLGIKMCSVVASEKSKGKRLGKTDDRPNGWIY